MGINNFKKRLKNHGFELVLRLQDKKRNRLEEGILTFNKLEQRKKSKLRLIVKYDGNEFNLTIYPQPISSENIHLVSTNSSYVKENEAISFLNEYLKAFRKNSL